MPKTWLTRTARLLFATVLLVALAGVPAAMAQDSLDDPSSAQYDPPLPEDTAGSTASGSTGSSGLDSNIGSLPFTGMDLLIVLGVALLLTGTGFALRRLSAPPDPHA
jgi:hypothetical protein